jgi:hypothetical protein
MGGRSDVRMFDSSGRNEGGDVADRVANEARSDADRAELATRSHPNHRPLRAAKNFRNLTCSEQLEIRVGC